MQKRRWVERWDAALIHTHEHTHAGKQSFDVWFFTLAHYAKKKRRKKEESQRGVLLDLWSSPLPAVLSRCPKWTFSFPSPQPDSLIFDQQLCDHGEEEARTYGSIINQQFRPYSEGNDDSFSIFILIAVTMSLEKVRTRRWGLGKRCTLFSMRWFTSSVNEFLTESLHKSEDRLQLWLPFLLLLNKKIRRRRDGAQPPTQLAVCHISLFKKTKTHPYSSPLYTAVGVIYPKWELSLFCSQIGNCETWTSRCDIHFSNTVGGHS